jgi:DNA modification methylase
MNRSYLGDCLEIMPDIADKSIDMILCDLPYGTTDCKWDVIIPFEPLWDQYKRIIKNNGAIVLTACQPFTSMAVMSNLKWFKYDWVWKKTSGTAFLNAKKQPLRDKEDILVFYKKQPTYNPQYKKGLPYKNKYGKTIKISKAGETTYGTFSKGEGFGNNNNGFRYPKTIIEFQEHRNIGSNKEREINCIHPTQKPVALFEYLIKTYTNEGDLVLDNCAGSFTTAIACINTNRKYICIEKEEEYFNKGQERIKKHLSERESDLWHSQTFAEEKYIST